MSVVEFKNCKLSSGEYKVTLSSPSNPEEKNVYNGIFKVGDKDCFKDVNTVENYQKILKYHGDECTLEAYQIARQLDFKEFAGILSVGKKIPK